MVLGAFILLTPLGIIATGDAWGEWDVATWNVPSWWKATAEGLANLWNAPLADYNLPGWDKGLLPYVGYVISGFIGVVLIYVLMKLLGKIIVRR